MADRTTQTQRRAIRKAIRERDGDNCHWCGDPMLFGLPVRHHRLMPTIEHIVPRWRGGSDELANLALAHRICNQQRNACDQKPLPWKEVAHAHPA